MLQGVSVGFGVDSHWSLSVCDGTARLLEEDAAQLDVRSVARAPRRSPAAPCTLYRQWTETALYRPTYGKWFQASRGTTAWAAYSRGRSTTRKWVKGPLKSRYNASLVQLIPLWGKKKKSSRGRIHSQRWKVSKSLPESLFFGTRGKRKLIKKTAIKQTLVGAFYVLLPPKNDFLQL